MNPVFNLNKLPIHALVLKCTSAFWFLMKLMSWKVWTANRIFPTLPFYEWTLKKEVHVILFMFSLVLLVMLLAFPIKKWIIALLIVSEMASLSLDYMRWQPWEYQFLITFILYLFFKNKHYFIYVFLLLLASIYFYSGLHKLNAAFLNQTWKNVFLKPIFNISDDYFTNRWIYYSGYLLALFEIALGLGLIFLKNKKLVLIAIALMHLFLILILGPTGLNYNSIVWPWNLVMIFYMLLFLKKERELFIPLFFFKKSITILFIFFIWILPATHFFGFWDSYLSYKLYAGNTKKAIICLKLEDSTSNLKKYKSKNKQFIPCSDKNNDLIYINNWALKELNVPIYPETRVFKCLKDKLILQYPKSQISIFEYSYPKSILLSKEIL